MKDIFFDLMFNILKCYMLHSELPFLPERMKIEKVEKLVANMYNIKEYVAHIRNLNRH